MASISKEPNGHRRILFVAPDGSRKTIRLGKVDQRSAETICRHAEALLASKIAAQPVPRETAVWLAEIKEPLREKLAKVGLVEPTEPRVSLTLGEHLDNYFAKRNDVKESTRMQWQNAARNLLTFFGADRRLESISAGDAKDFERWLRNGDARELGYAEQVIGDGLATNTARKRVSTSRMFFKDALERELIARNPFAGLKGSVGSNRARDYFVTREESAKILEACPDHQWRLIFALARFGGLRCPSEVLAITWADIDWNRNRLTVRSPKTERHEGKESREIPLFPELVPHLESSWDAAPENSKYVITRYRDARQNLRTTFLKIIHRAGLKPWPRVIQNLRASRATELAADYPAHVAAAWMGHSTLIASKHYWQVTDSDFERAVGGKLGDRGVSDGSAKAVQNPAQQTHAPSGKQWKSDLEASIVPSHNSFPCNNLRQHTTNEGCPARTRT